MTYRARHPAAFINVIADEGTKAEAVEWLQRTWDELCELHQGHVVLERFAQERAEKETKVQRAPEVCGCPYGNCTCCPPDQQ